MTEKEKSDERIFVESIPSTAIAAAIPLGVAAIEAYERFHSPWAIVPALATALSWIHAMAMGARYEKNNMGGWTLDRLTEAFFVASMMTFVFPELGSPTTAVVELGIAAACFYGSYLVSEKV